MFIKKRVLVAALFLADCRQCLTALFASGRKPGALPVMIRFCSKDVIAMRESE